MYNNNNADGDDNKMGRNINDFFCRYTILKK